MIQWQPQQILVRDVSGRRRPVDLGVFERKLNRALADCGIQESWLVDHLLVSLQDYSAVVVGESTSLDEQSLHRTLARMLLDSGYADVAARFAEQCRVPDAVADIEGRAAWDTPRIEAVLRRHLQGVERLIPQLREGVGERLERLGFARAGDKLIVELARHLISQWGEHERERDKREVSGEWLLAPGFWRTFLPPSATHLLRSETVDIRPISNLLPVIRLRWSMPRMIGQIENRPLTELQLLPQLTETAHQVAAIIEALVSHLNEKKQGGTVHPAHLTIIGLETMLAEEFAGEGKSRNLRRQTEILSLISEILSRHLRHRLIIATQEPQGGQSRGYCQVRPRQGA